MNTPSAALQDEINKRLTLNLLIQGSAEHAFLTSHYLVRDQLVAIDPDLLRLYDQIAIAGFLQYWHEGVPVLGWPDRFWQRARHPKHPFSKHPLLSRHGLMLTRQAKKYVQERARLKGVTRIPILFTVQFIKRWIQTWMKERKHTAALVELAKQATHQVWRIPPERLDAKLTESVAFGRLSKPTTIQASILRAGAAGYGGVRRRKSEFRVVGRALLWPLLSHELVKGTVELICMHGLNRLDATTYQAVVKTTDRIEYEPWMLQVGPELWRRLLPLLPDDRHVSEMVMHMARLPARSLEQLVLAVVEKPDWAREWLSELGRYDDELE